MPQIHAPDAWDISTGSTDVVVAVIDTGIDYSHPDLAANIWSAPSAFTVQVGGGAITCAAGTHGFNAINNLCDPMDDANHGTHVSGTIGGTGNNGAGVVGVNWTASIMGLKFLNGSGSGYTSDAVKAIVGGDATDFVTVETLDRDAGFWETSGGGPSCSVTGGSRGAVYWDETTATLPNGKPQIVTADGRFTANLRTVVMFDAGKYFQKDNPPPAVVNRLSQEVSRFLKTPETRERLFKVGTDAIGSSPAEAAAAMKGEITKWSRVIKEAGIKVE